jgi:integrase
MTDARKRSFSSLDGFQLCTKEQRQKYRKIMDNTAVEEENRLTRASPEEIFQYCSAGKESTRYTRMCICKDLGANTSLVQQDLNMYQAFYTTHTTLGRRFFDRYYKNLMLQVGPAMFLQPTDLSTKHLIDVVTHADKHQWTANSIMWNKALLKAGVHHGFLQPAMEATQASNPKEYWNIVRTAHPPGGTCPVTNKKSNTSDAHKAFKKLSEVRDTGLIKPFVSAKGMCLQQAIDFSMNSLRHFSCHNVLALISAGFMDLDGLKSAHQKQETLMLHWAEIAKGLDFHGESHVKVFLQLLDNSDCEKVEQILDLEHEAIVDIIVSCSYKRNAFRILECLLKSRGRETDINILVKSLPHYCTEMTMVDIFQNTPWRTQLFQDIMNPHTKRTEKTSHNPIMRNKEIGYMAVKQLWFMEDYALKNYPGQIPESMDPLRWFFGAATVSTLVDVMIQYGNQYEPSNDLVKSIHNRHHCSYVIALFMRLLKDDLKQYIMCSQALVNVPQKTILNDIENKRVAFSGKRRTFVDDEVVAMINVAKIQPGSELLLTLLSEVGLRVGCLSTVMYYDLFDLDNYPRNTCRVIEKNLQIREFMTGPNLKKVLVTFRRYVETECPNIQLEKFYVFNLKSPYKKTSTETIRKRLKKIGNAAGVGVVVHPHVFRHTVVGNLMKAGNSMDLVSKFIGHKNTEVTFRHYWLRDNDAMLINPHMSSAYTEEELKEEEQDNLLVANKKVDTLMGILSVFQDVIRVQCDDADGSAVAVRCEILKRVPDLQTILNGIAMSVDDMSSISGYSCMSSTLGN